MTNSELERNPRQDLRRLTIIIGSAVPFFGILLIAIIAYAGWSANISAAERERLLVDNALEQSIVRILNEQKSVAWWDDAVANVSAKFDPQWIEDNIGIFLAETYGQDEVYILNRENQPVFAYAKGIGTIDLPSSTRMTELADIVGEARKGPSGALRKRADGFAAGQQNYDFYSGVLQCARWGGHILSIDGKPAVVTGITICPNVQLELVTETPFLLISVVHIDEKFLSQVGASLLIPDLTLASAPVAAPGMFSEPFVVDDGTPAGILAWTTRRPGQVLLRVILPLVALGVLGTGILAGIMFRRLGKASSILSDREAQARHQAKHDALSTLPNRHHFVEMTDAALRKLPADGSLYPAVVAYIDVDRFKDINDTLGHHAGDELIKAISQRMRARIPESDFLARFGGDEFAVLRAPAGIDADADLAEIVSDVFMAPFSIVGQNIRATASVGISRSPDHGMTTGELMRHADIALYEAKRRGRNQALFFSAEMAEQVQYRRTVELALREALESDQLRLNYQPLISCATNAMTGVEALLRWKHPALGDISPAVFIPIAEESGLMPALGAWVLKRAIADARLWPELEVAINLSPAQFHHVDLVEFLKALLASSPVDTSRIVLEITEGLLLESNEQTNNTLTALRALGFRIALDDFGTGYSSLSYLSDFKFDKLKIDRSFVSGVSQTPNARTIVHAVVNLGRGLGMDVVAEGVETESEAAMMRFLGCTEMQGYYFSRPVDPSAIEGLRQQFAARARETAVPLTSPRKTSAV